MDANFAAISNIVYLFFFLASFTLLLQKKTDTTSFFKGI